MMIDMDFYFIFLLEIQITFYLTMKSILKCFTSTQIFHSIFLSRFKIVIQVGIENFNIDQGMKYIEHTYANVSLEYDSREYLSDLN